MTPRVVCRAGAEWFARSGAAKQSRRKARVTDGRTGRAGLKGAAGTIALVAAIVTAVAAPAGCSNSDCAYYGDPDTNTRCVVVGPSPADGGQ
jgi:hypothetical protein